LSKHHFYPVILAGGSGTRFWPRSRRHQAKQVLALEGKQTMIQKTVERLQPLATEDSFWIITNEFVGETIRRQLPAIPALLISFVWVDKGSFGRDRTPFCRTTTTERIARGKVPDAKTTRRLSAIGHAMPLSLCCSIEREPLI